MSHIVPTPPQDSGLQVERTALAWRRTALALATNALLILRAGAVRDQALVVALGTVLFAAAVLATAIAALRRRQRTGAPGPAEADAGAMLAMALLGVIGALFAAGAMALGSVDR